MKSKVMMLWTLAMLFTLTGCFANSNQAQKPELTQQDKLDHPEQPAVINEEQLTLDDMQKALKAEGIEVKVSMISERKQHYSTCGCLTSMNIKMF